LILSDADKAQLGHALAIVQEVLGSDAVGAYLFGSAILGGLRPDSDLDILVVSRRPTTQAEKQRLVHDLMATSGRRTSQGTLRRIELTIVVERDVKPWHYPPSLDFQYGDWLREQFKGGNVEPWPTTLKPDLALLITMVLLADTPVLGPRPSEFFDPVPDQDLLSAMLGDIDRLRGDVNSDTRNVVLTLARIWSTAATGVIRSKDAAAEWVLDRLPEPHRAVLARARAIYLGDLAERWDDVQADIASCVDYLIGEIRSITSASDEFP
jgi:predicted nucleotidyltransferase